MVVQKIVSICSPIHENWQYWDTFKVYGYSVIYMYSQTCLKGSPRLAPVDKTYYLYIFSWHDASLAKGPIASLYCSLKNKSGILETWDLFKKKKNIVKRKINISDCSQSRGHPREGQKVAA